MLRKDDLVGAIVYYDGTLPFSAFTSTLCCGFGGETQADHIDRLSKGKNNNSKDPTYLLSVNFVDKLRFVWQ